MQIPPFVPDADEAAPGVGVPPPAARADPVAWLGSVEEEALPAVEAPDEPGVDLLPALSTRPSTAQASPHTSSDSTASVFYACASRRRITFVFIFPGIV